MDSGITPLSPTDAAAREAKAANENYFIRVAIAFDMLVNTICLGQPDETISARAGRAATEGKLWGKIMSHFLDWFQKDHGALAEAGDYERAERIAYVEKDFGSSLPK